MSSTGDQTVTLDGVHNTLIDINGITTYFVSKVVVTPSAQDMSKKYRVGIVSQEELDSGEMNIREQTGVFSNMINKNSGGFQNLFLYLQSSEPMKDVNVSITTEEMPPPVMEELVIEPVDNPDTQHYYPKIAVAIMIIIFGIVMLRKFYNEKS